MITLPRLQGLLWIGFLLLCGVSCDLGNQESVNWNNFDFSHECDVTFPCTKVESLPLNTEAQTQLGCGRCIIFEVDVTNPCIQHEIEVTADEITTINITSPWGESLTSCTNCNNCTCSTFCNETVCDCLWEPNECYDPDGLVLTANLLHPREFPFSQVLRSTGRYEVAIRHDRYRGSFRGSGMNANIAISVTTVESFVDGTIHYGSTEVPVSYSSPRRCFRFSQNTTCDSADSLCGEPWIGMDDCVRSGCCAVNQCLTPLRLTHDPYWTVEPWLVFSNGTAMSKSFSYGVVVPRAANSPPGTSMSPNPSPEPWNLPSLRVSGVSPAVGLGAMADVAADVADVSELSTVDDTVDMNDAALGNDVNDLGEFGRGGPLNDLGVLYYTSQRQGPLLRGSQLSARRNLPNRVDRGSPGSASAAIATAQSSEGQTGSEEGTGRPARNSGEEQLREVITEVQQVELQGKTADGWVPHAGFSERVVVGSSPDAINRRGISVLDDGDGEDTAVVFEPITNPLWDDPSFAFVVSDGEIMDGRVWESCGRGNLSVALTEDDLMDDAFFLSEVDSDFLDPSISHGALEFHPMTNELVVRQSRDTLQGHLCPGENAYWRLKSVQADLNAVEVVLDWDVPHEYDVFYSGRASSRFPYDDSSSDLSTVSGGNSLYIVPENRCLGHFYLGLVPHPSLEKPVSYTAHLDIQQPQEIALATSQNDTVCLDRYMYYMLRGDQLKEDTDVRITITAVEGNPYLCISINSLCTMHDALWSCSTMGDCIYTISSSMANFTGYTYYFGVYGHSVRDGLGVVSYEVLVQNTGAGTPSDEDPFVGSFFFIGVGLVGLLALSVVILLYRNREYQRTLGGASYEPLLDDNPTSLPPPLLKSMVRIGGAASEGQLDSRYARIEGLSKKGGICPAQIQLEERIGFGSYGEVFRGRWQGVHVAVKMILNKNLTPDVVDSLVTEVSLLSNLRHPNIVQYLGVSTDPKQFFIVLEYCAEGSVYDLLRNGRITDEHILLFARDAAVAVAYLQNSQPIVLHRDLKTQNLLVDDHLVVKVCDFGLARVKAEGAAAMTAVGTACFAAPEVLMHGKYDQAADVYSFGIILWEMSHDGENPYPDMNPVAVGLKVVNERLRPKIRPDVDPQFVQLMQSCWAQDPAQRPTFDQIVTRLTQMIDSSLKVHIPAENAMVTFPPLSTSSDADDIFV